MKKALNLLLISFLMFALSVGAFAVETDDNNSAKLGYNSENSFIAKAYDVIKEFVDKDEALFWTDESTICSSQPLYNFDGEIVGYEFGISTGSENTGCVRIVNNGNILEFARAQFDGQPDYITLSKYIAEESVDGKLYYNSDPFLLIKVSDGAYRYLWLYDTIDESTARKQYADYIEKYVQNVEIPLAAKKELLDSRNSSDSTSPMEYSWCIYQDFSNIWITNLHGITMRMQDCCSPLAATNICRYFRHKDRSLDVLHNSEDDMLINLYIQMDTNEYSTSTGTYLPGTLTSNIRPGLINYCSAAFTRIPLTDELNYPSTGSLKNYLDSGYLLLSSIHNYQGVSNHTVVIIGYSGNVLYMADGATSYHKVALSTNNTVYHCVPVKF